MTRHDLERCSRRCAPAARPCRTRSSACIIRCGRRRSRTWASPASTRTAPCGRASPRSCSGRARRRRRSRPSPSASWRAARRCSSRAPRPRRRRLSGARVPAASYNEVARTVTLRQQDVEPGRGTVLVVCAGTSDLPVAEEAAVTADLMGNVVERLYDVGVAGIHRLLARARAAGRRARDHRGGRHGGRAAERRGGPGARAGGRGADERRLRRQLRRRGGAARHAEQLRQRRVGGEHRQRLRRGLRRVGHHARRRPEANHARRHTARARVRPHRHDRRRPGGDADGPRRGRGADAD